MQSFNFLNNLSKNDGSTDERTNLDSFMQAINKHAIVSITDADGIILYVNKNFCTISQYSSENLIGNTHKIINSGYHSQEFFKNMWETIQQGKTWQGEIRNRAKDGSYYWVLSTIQPFTDDNGNIVQYVSIRTDITQQKEEELLAKEENRTKGRFLANMSHEIRTPLTTIIGLSFLAEEEENQVKVAALLKQIRKSGEYLLHTLDDVLDFAKIDEGKLELRENEFNIVQAVEQVLDMAKDNNVNRNSISYTISPHVNVAVVGDENKLKQILLNLISNSAKFTKNGNIDVNVYIKDTTNNQEDKQFVTFDVIDNGCGIETHQLNKIFSPFIQLDNTSARSAEGSGLGLTISSHLVELMGGELSVESTPKVKTVFSFTLPFTADTVEGLSSTDDTSVKTNNTSVDETLVGNILLVEDNIVNRMIAVEMLQKLGMSVVSVANGKEAVSYFQNNKQAEYCDLVLLDLHMPVMDGWEAVSLIRLLPTGKTVPIVALSADVLAETKAACLQAGMNDHLNKPFTFDSLTKIIRKWVINRKEEKQSYWSYLDIKNRTLPLNIS